VRERQTERKSERKRVRDRRSIYIEHNNKLSIMFNNERETKRVRQRERQRERDRETDAVLT